MKKILIIGKGGQVSENLIALLSNNKKYQFLALGQKQLDLSRSQEVVAKLNTLNFQPDVIINAAAYTAVDLAEDERVKCDNINNISVREIAHYAAKHKALLVHYSTDYVYSGTGTQEYIESDTAALKPQNHYGATKLAGENAVIASGCEYLILRTSWVYNHAGKNFVLTMLKLAAEREELKIVADQIGSPTYARDIADITLQMVAKFTHNSGIYHFVPPQKLSWHQFTSLIVKKARELGFYLKIKDILPQNTADYPTKAARPLNSRLSVEKLKKDYGLQFPSIEDSLTQCLLNIRDKK